jgi:hypothetical protein
MFPERSRGNFRPSQPVHQSSDRFQSLFDVFVHFDRIVLSANALERTRLLFLDLFAPAGNLIEMNRS